MVPPGQLTEPTNFQCGDVVVFGIVDHLRSDGSIVPPDYPCTVTFFAARDFFCRGRPRERIDPTTGQPVQIQHPNEDLYYEDPGHALLNAFYQYPDTYLIIPFVVPDITQIPAATLGLFEQARLLGPTVTVENAP